MANQAMSLHIGLDKIESGHYGTEGRLKGCENDANFMDKLATAQGFKTTLLLTPAATIKAVKNEIIRAKNELIDDGVFLITFSGHGGQTTDSNNNEFDGLDETWCLYNEQMNDDELFELLVQFKEGQKILIISDSCHSGTIADPIASGFTEFNRIIFGASLVEHGFQLNLFDNDINYNLIEWNNILPKLKDMQIELREVIDVNKYYQGYRFLPKSLTDIVYFSHQPLYDEKQRITDENLTTIANQSGHPIVDFRELLKASVISISACQDWQLSGESTINEDGEQMAYGYFTLALKDVWENEGGTQMNYIQFHEAIWKKLKQQNVKQNPNYSKIGHPNSNFEMQNCFTI